MPQLKIQGVEVNDICKISVGMVQEMQELLQCPKSYFTLECINSTYIMDGEIVKVCPTVEVAWFDRGQEVQDTMAKIVTKYIHSAGYKDVDVIFSVLEENKYYENGEHF
jgi:Zn-finger nucleic acid-binding protein